MRRAVGGKGGGVQGVGFRRGGFLDTCYLRYEAFNMRKV